MWWAKVPVELVEAGAFVRRGFTKAVSWISYRPYIHTWPQFNILLCTFKLAFRASLEWKVSFELQTRGKIGGLLCQILVCNQSLEIQKTKILAAMLEGEKITNKRSQWDCFVKVQSTCPPRDATCKPYKHVTSNRILVFNRFLIRFLCYVHQFPFFIRISGDRMNSKAESQSCV